MQKLLDRFRVKVTTLQNYTVKTASNETVAREYLTTPEGRSATALLMAIRTLYSIEALYWEPETLWITMDKDGFDLSEEARDAVQAAISVIRNPSFFFDNLVFQRTTQAFNNELYDPESLQECNAAHMAWAVYEASLLRGMDPETQDVPEIDEDVQQYMAVCLQRGGFVCPPDQLSMVASNLLHLLAKGAEAQAKEVKKSWAHLDKEALQDRNFPEDPLGVQLAKLSACYLYVKERAESLATDVLLLENAV